MDASPIYISNPMPGVSAPASGISAIKPRGVNTLEDALSLLSLVNVGKEVLDISSLQHGPSVIIKIAQEIINLRKTGSNVEFENGRIKVPKDVFENIVTKAQEQASNEGRTSVVKEKNPGVTVIDNGAPKKAPEQLPQKNVDIPFFAPPPPVVEIKKRKSSSASKETSAASLIVAEGDEDSLPMLSSDQAYFVLVDITSPEGGKYIIQVREKFEDSQEERKELEKGLEEFWGDFGNDLSVKSRNTSFVIKPKLLFGAYVNSEVSKRLVAVYISQSTQEKIKNSRIVSDRGCITIKPVHGNISVTFSNKELISYLMKVQTTLMDSGNIGADKIKNGKIPDIETKKDKPIPPPQTP